VKRKAIIFDIDGTLANIWHRRKDFDKKHFDVFMSKMDKDTVNLWCKTLMVAMGYMHYDILLVTGRGEEWRETTENWLQENEIYCDRLFMRPAANNEKDSLIKTQIYNQLIKDEYEILFVVDDRQQVVDSWRELGLVCLQCDVGDY